MVIVRGNKFPDLRRITIMANTKKQELFTIEISAEGFTADKMDNLRKLIDSKAVLFKKALQIDELPISLFMVSD
jgi:hypothetical protein